MNRIKFRTVELHLKKKQKNEYNGSVENNRAADKRIEAFKYRSEKITQNAEGKKKMQNIKGKLNMIYILRKFCMLISISEKVETMVKKQNFKS